MSGCEVVVPVVCTSYTRTVVLHWFPPPLPEMVTWGNVAAFSPRSVVPALCSADSLVARGRGAPVPVPCRASPAHLQLVASQRICPRGVATAGSSPATRRERRVSQTWSSTRTMAALLLVFRESPTARWRWRSSGRAGVNGGTRGSSISPHVCLLRPEYRKSC